MVIYSVSQYYVSNVNINRFSCYIMQKCKQYTFWMLFKLINNKINYKHMKYKDYKERKKKILTNTFIYRYTYTFFIFLI